MTKILILCTGNSCRSQMAEGFLASFDSGLEVLSAGTFPAMRVHPLAVQVMKEEGIDIARHSPKSVDQFTKVPFDYVITVCDDAKEACPVFTGVVRHRIHIPFDDPSQESGPPEKLLPGFRRVRDEIKMSLLRLYNNRIKQQK